MSIRHIKVVMENPAFTSTEKGVLVSLAYHANKEDRVFNKISTIAAESGLTEKPIRATLNRLRECGCITITRRPPKPAIFVLQTVLIAQHYSGQLTAATQVDLPGSLKSIDRGTQVDLPGYSGQSTGVPPYILNRTLTVPLTVDFPGLATLREIPGWDERGEPEIDTLAKWVARKDHSDALLEGTALKMSAAPAKTLKDRNLARVFQVWANAGYAKQDGRYQPEERLGDRTAQAIEDAREALL